MVPQDTAYGACRLLLPVLGTKGKNPTKILRISLRIQAAATAEVGHRRAGKWPIQGQQREPAAAASRDRRCHPRPAQPSSSASPSPRTFHSPASPLRSPAAPPLSTPAALDPTALQPNISLCPAPRKPHTSPTRCPSSPTTKHTGRPASQRPFL